MVLPPLAEWMDCPWGAWHRGERAVTEGRDRTFPPKGFLNGVKNMGDSTNPPEEAQRRRWRPAVAPFRPRSARRLRPRKPAPGQMTLPGIDTEADLAEAAETIGTGSDPLQAAEARGQRPNPQTSTPGLTCPNCGATEFDDDGDCTRCWEPGVVRVETESEAEPE